MKNIAIYTVLMLSLIFASCEKLLDVEAENTISGDVLKDTESIQKALIGAYYNFCGIADGTNGGELLGGDFIVIPEVLARISPSGGNQEYFWQTTLADEAYSDFRNKAILETNARVEANWQRAYETLNNVNMIIANIDNVTDASEKARIHGEALAIRGILLYEMTLLWAPDYNVDLDFYPEIEDPSTQKAIFIRTTPIVDVNDIPKLSADDLNTTDEAYDQAIADLTEASTYLESFGKNGTGLSYYACQAYLAKISLQLGEYADAESYAEEVISSGVYSLVSNPLLAFNNTSNSSEDIFAIQQTLANNVGDRNSSEGFGLINLFSSLTESGIGVYRLSTSILEDTSNWYNSPFFHTDDVRGSIDLTTNTSSTSGQITTAYYKSVVDAFDGALSTGKFTSSENVLPIIRLAEMHLIRAEANFFRLNENVSSKAINDLNEIRTRAGINAIPTSYTNATGFLDSLILERRREFMHEGMILEDLRRFGGYIGKKNNSNLEFDPWDPDYVLPIPRSERDTWK